MSTVIQNFLIPKRGFPASLHACLIDAAGKKLNLRKYLNSGIIDLEKGVTLSANTYFNSFYTSYWISCTSLRNIAIRIRFTGTIIFRIYEDGPIGGKVLLLERKLSVKSQTEFGDRKLDIPADWYQEFDEPVSSRYFYELTALTPVRLKSIDFMTNDEPNRNITFTIGICTFNREEFLVKTLQELKRFYNNHKGLISKIFVVNQGNDFQNASILEITAEVPFVLISQPNLGGCGGFTRTMLEALSLPHDEAGSHHIVMDDDIVLDARILTRTARFLAYADPGIAVGAPMLDSVQPAVVYEAGGFFTHEPSRVHLYANNIDMSSEDNMYYFNKYVEVDYNGWWYFVASLDQIKQTGLPAPYFMRGDDIEYARRLGEIEVTTVSLPGIGIWHEPFYTKGLDWQLYYENRNRLIFSARHSDDDHIDMWDILGEIFYNILCHKYHIAAWIIKAYHDYLAGPDKVFAVRGDDRHKEIMSFSWLPVQPARPRRLRQAVYKKRPIMAGRPRPDGHWRTVFYYVMRLSKLLLLPYGNKQRIFVEADVHPKSVLNGSYIVTNWLRSYHLRYTPDRRNVLYLTLTGVYTVILWRFKRSWAKRVWRERLPHFETVDHWRSELGLPESYLNEDPNRSDKSGSCPLAETGPT